MENYSPEEIQRLLKAYEAKRLREKKNYQNIKNNPDFKKKNCQNAKDWYKENKNKESRTKKYQDNKELHKAKVNYNYYKKRNRVEEFKKKHPEKYKILQDHYYIKEANPSESTSISISSSDAEPSM